jgi:hypothetical protein
LGRKEFRQAEGSIVGARNQAFEAPLNSLIEVRAARFGVPAPRVGCRSFGLPTAVAAVAQVWPAS